MSEPLPLSESLALANLHVPDHKLAVIVGIDQYHNVASLSDDNRSALPDQPRCLQQVNEIEEFVQRFGFGVIKYVNPDYETLDKMLQTVQQTAIANQKAKPEKKMTVFYFFSGIAINDGSHSLLVNEVDPKTQFYQVYRIEARIRILARRYPNTHHICLFASCRILPSS